MNNVSKEEAVQQYLRIGCRQRNDAIQLWIETARELAIHDPNWLEYHAQPRRLLAQNK